MRWIRRTKYFEVPGSLYPHDIRHNPSDRAFVDLAEPGTLRIRLWAEPGIDDLHVVIGGEGTRMNRTGATRRMSYWEALITARQQIRYTFAGRDQHRQPVYYTATGVAGAVEGPYGEFIVDPGALQSFEVPEWARGAVIYQIFPERFAPGDPGLTPEGAAEWGSDPHGLIFQGGDLVGITERLDHVASLGVNAIYLNPIFTSPSTHKYDAADFLSVDPALGGDAAFAELVELAHERDIRVIIDGAFDHCHPTFFAFADLMEHGARSRYASWFDVESFPLRVRWRPHLRAPWHTPEYIATLESMLTELGLSLEAASDDGPPLDPTYRAWYHVPTMPQVNLDDPGARAYFVDVARYWVREFGVDGWRMDVAREPSHEFWRAVREAVRAERSDVYLLAEIWGDTSAWLQGDEFDATMNYTFRDLCVGFFATGALSGPGFADGIIHMRHMYSTEVEAVNHNLLSSHDVKRFREEAAGNLEAMMLATAFQLTFTGAPGLYYGDEVGMAGGKDPANRGAFPWHQTDGWDGDMLELVRSLTGLRREYPALRYGDFEFTDVDDRSLAYRRSHAGEVVDVWINAGNEAVEIEIPESAEVLYGAQPVAPRSCTIVRR